MGGVKERSAEQIQERLAFLQKVLRDLQRYLKARTQVPVPVDDEELWLHLDGAEFMTVLPGNGMER